MTKRRARCTHSCRREAEAERLVTKVQRGSLRNVLRSRKRRVGKEISEEFHLVLDVPTTSVVLPTTCRGTMGECNVAVLAVVLRHRQMRNCLLRFANLLLLEVAHADQMSKAASCQNLTYTGKLQFQGELDT